METRVDPSANPAATLRFGTSGIPLSTVRPSTDTGIRRAAEFGLTCLGQDPHHAELN